MPNRLPPEMAEFESSTAFGPVPWTVLTPGWAKTRDCGPGKAVNGACSLRLYCTAASTSTVAMRSDAFPLDSECKASYGSVISQFVAGGAWPAEATLWLEGYDAAFDYVDSWATSPTPVPLFDFGVAWAKMLSETSIPRPANAVWGRLFCEVSPPHDEAGFAIPWTAGDLSTGARIYFDTFYVGEWGAAPTGWVVG